MGYSKMKILLIVESLNKELSMEMALSDTKSGRFLLANLEQETEYRESIRC